MIALLLTMAFADEPPGAVDCPAFDTDEDLCEPNVELSSPADGRVDVPIDTIPLVAGRFCDDPVLLGDAEPVPVEIRQAANALELVPSAPLQPDTEHMIVLSSPDTDDVEVRFVTGSGQTPAAPDFEQSIEWEYVDCFRSEGDNGDVLTQWLYHANAQANLDGSPPDVLWLTDVFGQAQLSELETGQGWEHFVDPADPTTLEFCVTSRLRMGDGTLSDAQTQCASLDPDELPECTAPIERGRRCGCAHSGGSSGWLGLLVLGLVARRRTTRPAASPWRRGRG